ncbi:3'-5' exoribonuclease YhaM family protein [Desulfonatronum sp. SC1]|uniref:3'-5' exoribonuclease YhaM family protein n=1 Tax=Desulfonatronum sp. SC1 TaxID=2109626 RepID=UPI000D3008B0|nr:HD domain-containing protein [Desulfonatronum sp. SC1]PTN38512.1 DNA-binding protein [Desulfonatronum sp. SC1]
MAVQKKMFIPDIQPGTRIDEVFVLVEARQGQARNGPYWQVRLQDARGAVDGKIWSPVSQNYPELPVGEVVRVAGSADLFRDQLQLRIEQLEAVTAPRDQIDWSLFLPRSVREPEEMLLELEELCKRELHHAPWRKFCRKILQHPEIRSRLLLAPGAKSMHHAYIGGLLEHTLSVCRLSLAISDQYPEVDREVLLVGAVFHDLGKAWELDAGIQRDYTDPGRLLGHILLGLEVLEPFLAKNDDLAPGLKLHLKHLLASHHGTYEYGSPSLPKTSEALILHYADNLDAKVNMTSVLVQALPEETTWTPYQRSMERQFYRPERTPKPETKRPAAANRTERPGVRSFLHELQPKYADVNENGEG